MVSYKSAVVFFPGRGSTRINDNYYFNSKIITEDLEGSRIKLSQKNEKTGVQVYGVSSGTYSPAFGRRASFAAVSCLRKYHAALLKNPETDIENLFREFCKEASFAVAARNSGDESPSRASFAAICVQDDGLTAMNIGNVRIYRYNGALSLLSEEHTQARKMVEMGLLTEQKAASHPQRWKLTRFLGGTPDAASPAVRHIRCGGGETFILCGSGCNDFISEDRLINIIESNENPADVAAAFAAAFGSESDEDCTVLVIKTYGSYEGAVLPGQTEAGKGLPEELIGAETGKDPAAAERPPRESRNDGFARPAAEDALRFGGSAVFTDGAPYFGEMPETAGERTASPEGGRNPFASGAAAGPASAPPAAEKHLSREEFFEGNESGAGNYVGEPEEEFAAPERKTGLYEEKPVPRYDDADEEDEIRRSLRESGEDESFDGDEEEFDGSEIFAGEKITKSGRKTDASSASEKPSGGFIGAIKRFIGADADGDGEEEQIWPALIVFAICLVFVVLLCVFGVEMFRSGRGEPAVSTDTPLPGYSAGPATETPGNTTEKPSDTTESPTDMPTGNTGTPTDTPVPPPTAGPTEEPPVTAQPTERPPETAAPTEEPPTTAEPTEEPPTTAEPTEEPPTTAEPTEEPPTTAEPTEEPPETSEPTEEPPETSEPTEKPPETTEPTEEPPATAEPTEEPPEEETPLPEDESPERSDPTENPEETPAP